MQNYLNDYYSAGVVLPEIIGLPPGVSNEEVNKNNPELIKENFHIIRIQPRFSTIDIGMVAIKSTDAHEKYYEFLAQLGISADNVDSTFLTFAVLNEGSISDGVNNSYGPSFLGSTIQGFSGQGLSEVVSLGKRINRNTKTGQIISGVSDMMKTGVSGLVDQLRNLLSVKKGTSSDILINKGEQAISKLSQGFRIDMGNIWTGSSASSNYSVTVRLYNPNPHDYNMFRKYIVAPLAAILTLVVPFSDDGVFYDRPFIARIEAPGMYLIKEAAITSVNVTKGGDSNDYYFNQRPNSIDVRISFESIYPTMVNVVQDSNLDPSQNVDKVDSVNLVSVGPPTLRQYIKNIDDDKYKYNILTQQKKNKRFNQPDNNNKKRQRRNSNKDKKIFDLL